MSNRERLDLRIKFLAKILKDEAQRLLAGLETPPAFRLVDRMILGQAVFLRYRTGTDNDFGDSNIAIDALKSALTCIPIPNSNKNDSLAAFVHFKLGNVYLERLLRTGRRRDADDAETHFKQAVGHKRSHFRVIANLAWICRYRYEMTGTKRFLEDGLQLVENAIVQAPSDHSALPFLLEACGLILLSRSELDGATQDLDLAIELLRTSANLSSKKRNDLVRFHLNLSQALCKRFTISEQKPDFDQAVSELETVIAVPDKLPRDIALCYAFRGSLLLIQFSYWKDKKDLEEGLRSGVELVRALMKHGHVPTINDMFVTIGEVMRIRYFKLGHSDNLSEAYACIKKGCNNTQLRSSDWRSRRVETYALYLLGMVQRNRYNKFGSPAFLEESISAFRLSAAITNPHHASFAVRASELCDVLRKRYEATHASPAQRKADLEEASAWLVRALRAPMPPSPRDRARFAIEIGHYIWEAQKAGRNISAVDNALHNYEKAVEFATTEFDTQIDAWHNLAKAYIMKGDLLHDMKAYEAASDQVKLIEESMDKMKEKATGIMPTQARLYTAQYKLSGEKRHGEQAIEVNYKIFNNSRYDLRVKVQAALENGNLERQVNSDTKACAEAIATAMDLMLRYTSEGYSRSDQLSVIREYSKLPNLAALAAVLAGGDVLQIVQIFEKGRSIIWDRLLSWRSPVNELREKQQDLADRLVEIRNKLLRKEERHRIFNDVELDRFQLATEYDEIMIKIRSQEEFKDFLLPPKTVEKLNAHAVDGPVVIIVPGAVAVALIITSAKSFTLNLPKFGDDQCNKAFESIQKALSTSDSGMMHDLLRWLWISAALPVLESLGFHGRRTPDEQLPRLWWITSGFVNLLPLHAAGDHEKAAEIGEPCTLLDRAICSYSPTLKALSYAKTRMRDLVSRSRKNNANRSVLLAAMETTMERKPLPNTPKEVDAVASILGAQFSIRKYIKPLPTKRDVVLGLRQCTIAHLACHGEVNNQDPLKSRILLADWGRCSLNVNSLMRMTISNCQLAYLSACETAVNRDPALRDEGLHLSGAFQMAGVPNTIATSWEIMDIESVQVAIDFYNGLKGPNGEIDVSKSAASLNSAVLRMRNAKLSPLVWAAYIHFGV
ncbi:hypothetical protein L228DRAFT_271688 [Xylona heveae TC161]|uniref:CHAT domain-containing protein n=1 Tax=Xylona heveae (strain CBS 132557 / TC161) TaxID=1328760 RepID=A0A164ZGB2_XYLHT|nr:hypothetical protein L228DRAFT_271688 [Xylona heveae TC161]KZF19066.1 hypothetical protein L228DRAFT_271688 [Xylona heveae TC161]